MKRPRLKVETLEGVPVIPWEELKSKLDPETHARLMKWLYGQTTTPFGVYSWDVDRFFAGLPVID